MKLSVLIPMYNAEDYISNCLDSLIHQDLSENDYEIVIIDDGSVDKSFKIADKYVKTRTNVFLFAESNAGSDTTRNKLLKIAKGDYIYFLDADDYIAHNSLGLMLDYLQGHDLDFLGFETLKTNDLRQYELDSKDNNTSFSEIHNGLEYIKNNRNLRHEVWWYIAKRSLVYDNDLAFDENGNNADVVFTINLLLKANRLVYCSLPIHRYVQTTGSVMRSKPLSLKRKLTDSMFSMIMSYSQLINGLEDKKINDKDIILENLKFRRDVFAFFNIINMIRLKYGTEDFKERINQLSKVRAYPINNFIKNHYNNLLYSILNKMINNKRLLLYLVKTKNKFWLREPY